jgi:hypothetical protein
MALHQLLHYLLRKPLYSLSETNADAFLPEINKLVYNPSGAVSSSNSFQ